MGSEAPAAESFKANVTFHLTGFKKFHGVADNPNSVIDNPTEVVISNIKEHISRHGLPPGATLGSCTILETAGAGALETLINLLDSAIPVPSSRSSPNQGVKPQKIVWIHFGVNIGATKFAIERKAFNQANFRCPDEMGWKPQHVAIVREDGPQSHFRETSLPVGELVEYLSKEAFQVTSSDDAGRFVCNYVYYHSLRHAAAHSTKSVFVHVPSFSVMDEGTQMQFVVALLHAIAAVGA